MKRAVIVGGAIFGTVLSRAAFAASSKTEALASRPLVLIAAMAALSLIPFALLMLTCFVRVSVVLSILRSAIGAAQVPPTQVLTGLAILLTLFVMAPTGERIYRAVEPVLNLGAGADLLSGQTVQALVTAGDRAKEPLRDFLLKHGDRRDRTMFYDLALKMRAPDERAGISEQDLMVVAPAFVVSELRRAFEIGFLLFVPFLIIDLVIANLLLALGMHMLSPPTVSLPFKLLLFVLADGWHLVVRGLIESYL
ncbi:MAG TPA: type III secretion system export apparatus subunit SctR [Polyangia bacterium]|nr:type III secretion system export apparatus subunit SctR [Polyangia bacterium]